MNIGAKAICEDESASFSLLTSNGVFFFRRLLIWGDLETRGARRVKRRVIALALTTCCRRCGEEDECSGWHHGCYATTIFHYPGRKCVLDPTKGENGESLLPKMIFPLVCITTTGSKSRYRSLVDGFMGTRASARIMHRE